MKEAAEKKTYIMLVIHMKIGASCLMIIIPLLCVISMCDGVSESHSGLHGYVLPLLTPDSSTPLVKI
jgi:hypothetical protein